MKRKVSYIAWLLTLVFAAYFAPQILLSTTEGTLKKQSVCYQRACNNRVSSENAMQTFSSASKKSNLKPLEIPCENYFLAQVMLNTIFSKTSEVSNAYFFKIDIHSPPDINRIDPPPINGRIFSRYQRIFKNV